MDWAMALNVPAALCAWVVVTTAAAVMPPMSTPVATPPPIKLRRLKRYLKRVTAAASLADADVLMTRKLLRREMSGANG
jgi:hypothetical protein